MIFPPHSQISLWGRKRIKSVGASQLRDQKLKFERD